MGFIDDDFDLETDLIERRAIPPGENEKKFNTAARMNTTNGAANNLRDWIRAALWYGFSANAADPEPANVANYIWLKSDGTLWKTVNGSASEIGSGGGGGTITPDANRNVFIAGGGSGATTAADCTSSGYHSLNSVTTALGNCAFGSYALEAGGNGSANAAFGFESLKLPAWYPWLTLPNELVLFFCASCPATTFRNPSTLLRRDEVPQLTFEWPLVVDCMLAAPAAKLSDPDVRALSAAFPIPMLPVAVTTPAPIAWNPIATHPVAEVAATIDPLPTAQFPFPLLEINECHPIATESFAVVDVSSAPDPIARFRDPLTFAFECASAESSVRRARGCGQQHLGVRERSNRVLVRRIEHGALQRPYRR